MSETIFSILADAASTTAVHAEPTALGLTATAWVSISMLLLIGIFVWKKVPALITSGLDKKIAEIKSQLEEAETLRAEAEALKDKYAARMSGAQDEADALIAQAKAEADDLLTKANADTAALIARRKSMAEDKINAAQLAAISDLKAKVSQVAINAASNAIAAKHDATADKDLVEKAINSIN
ncbi:F0F1 ATP synthase subunit B [Sphingorhabdus lutea]|uniref:ATP synthase subunit b n=1 Tax=Sphingorhabdus lutea TaxID=1913578 RepID=A0A1L3JBP0_9SPHN|nr:F0F1 ATP synthase subunit B [Sphingorhabdus lutea]APG62542.1 F0F1 ATP synthase subunit B [Sphingorhabdus lutea]